MKNNFNQNDLQFDIFENRTDFKLLQNEENQLTPKLISFRELVPEIQKTNYSTHGVYNYPAKFIPQIVRGCIKSYTKENDLIIDPFAGSGTTGLEAILCKRNAFLLDLNLILNHIIPLKIPILNDALKISNLEKLLGEMFLSEVEFYPSWSNLDYWYPKEFLNVFVKFWGWIKSQETNLYTLIIESVLVKASRVFSLDEDKAPKLFKSKRKTEFINELLAKDWEKLLVEYIFKNAKSTLRSVKELLSFRQNEKNTVNFFGGVDSAYFEFEKDLAFDCLITSPPYLQAQEYIRTSKLDLFWLGYTEKDVRRISRLEIPYRKADEIFRTKTLTQIKDSLSRPKLIPILDSYFCFTIKALENSMKKLKLGSKACIFVGNPKIDGIEVEIWKILREYFEEKGFKFNAVYEDRIQNRQLFGSRKNKNPDGMKSEFLLVLTKEF